ncbi:uncharacterized protein BO95DRAFT_173659 [Aspergillus brunneoviolaceus CBS 621.78]|uniref:Uncharacterized protein n=1 Tax=Aspergillus brunneoviolaceus CBS 621.78 TaxID=1450534 RepID=A0ACD1G5I2_9EURO|nr:hypothetical protein BO95DRAFT_173659 [Aspergillus brunneoviolaceus CBS 621.78]RAH44483.1 hypothetical protein BO95DRAFT_173659 [Aspergillus brunneoviolaceus CBS 621.78]
MVIVSPSSLAPLSLPRSLALPGVISLRSSSLASSSSSASSAAIRHQAISPKQQPSSTSYPLFLPLLFHSFCLSIWPLGSNHISPDSSSPFPWNSFLPSLFPPSFDSTLPCLSSLPPLPPSIISDPTFHRLVLIALHLPIFTSALRVIP